VEWVVGLIFTLAGVGFIVAVISQVARVVNSTTRNVRDAARFIKDASKNIQQADLDIAQTPKSLSGGDAIYLRKVKADHPEFNIDLAKSEVENCISDIFVWAARPRSEQEFKAKYNQKIHSDSEIIVRKHGKLEITDMKIHRTAMCGYISNSENSTIRFQTALQYDYKDKSRTTQRQQVKIETAYSYKMASGGDQDNLALRCSYCGAPLKKIGKSVCEFCGNKVVLDQDKVWEVTDVTEKL
jgi:hypothetical protein